MPRGFSFSWSRALGISSAKARLSREIGIPLTSSGRQRKIGRMGSGWFAALLVESGHQAFRSSNRRSRRTVDVPEGTSEGPVRPPSVVGTFGACLGSVVAGGIAGLVFESSTAFWIVSALMVALVVADHHGRATKWREAQVHPDAPLPPTKDL
jgi:hypothetical protein